MKEITIAIVVVAVLLAAILAACILLFGGNGKSRPKKKRYKEFLPYQYKTQKYKSVDFRKYEIKTSMTDTEKKYWRILQRLYSYKYIITPQVPLSSIVNKIKEDAVYASELNRVIDFGIFTKEYNLIALVEINDKSHYETERATRDRKVQKILDEAGIGYKLVTIWTDEPATDSFVHWKLRKLIK